MGTTVYQTVTTPRSTDPVWGSKHVFDFSAESDELVAEVWDAETFGGDILLGVCRTSIGEIRKGQVSDAGLRLCSFAFLLYACGVSLIFVDGVAFSRRQKRWANATWRRSFICCRRTPRHRRGCHR